MKNTAGQLVNTETLNQQNTEETPYQRLARLGIVLPSPPTPVANFETHVIDDRRLYLSGQGPIEANGLLHTGKVGEVYDVDQAYDMARLVGVNLISVMHAALGDLRRVRRIVKVLGMVNAVPAFSSHPHVINGCSDLLLEVFGAAGSHARSAVGLCSLPDNIPVEIEAIVSITD
ncbi:MAG: RidA family protein [Burkholderiaceae bacterium]|nr:RidA family protein [Burkholderiaceae bacterium]